jgi:hypothetical protein
MNSNLFKTPILFLIFNRPDTTERVFQKIREIQPRQLFISADGPRPDKKDEQNKCEEARRIIQRIDWKCDLKTNLSNNNLGCRVGVSSGIDWFFSQVHEGIILEDDCLPDISFFRFCGTLLEYYRNNERIMHIGGANFQDGNIRGDGSYYFSNINHVWGWATWKRAWGKYDIAISSYPELWKQNIFHHKFPNSRIEKFWKKKFDLAYNNKIDTWDIQWQYVMSVNNGLAIIPNRNLIANIGFDNAATHTIDKFNNLADIPTAEMDTMIHPSQIVPDFRADSYAFQKYFAPSKIRKLLYLIVRKKLFRNYL